MRDAPGTATRTGATASGRSRPPASRWATCVADCGSKCPPPLPTVKGCSAPLHEVLAEGRSAALSAWMLGLRGLLDDGRLRIDDVVEVLRQHGQRIGVAGLVRRIAVQ